jgi:hypothetical protein
MKPSNYLALMGIVFLATLPFSNPWVRGDGVGYYAYVRSLLVEHRLDFANDWRHANPSFRLKSVSPQGDIAPEFYTATGHIKNIYAVGASLLWAPFLVPVHAGVLVWQRCGGRVAADGFSRPYVLTMALATALYGFLGIAISFLVARRFVAERFCLLAALAIWFASSLPVYMYFNPAYSHAHSAFAAALLLWYWHRTRPQRSFRQWIVLGLLSGLLLDVYYLNVAILLVPLVEALRAYGRNWRAPGHAWMETRRLFAAHLAYGGATLVGFLPTLITRWIVNGHPLALGYDDLGFTHWFHPKLWQPLVSSNHGLLVWTPVVIPALAGLLLLRQYDRELAVGSLAAVAALYYTVACHTDWHGLSSFGNRFFISLTPFFVLGLAVALQEASRCFKRPRAASVVLGAAMGALILWNLAFIFQWGTGLVPHRGPISWRQMAYNQFVVVPARMGGAVRSYFANRRGMMERIEEQDVNQMRRHDAVTPEH